MKRGFLNSKKAKEQHFHDSESKAEISVLDPLKPSPSGDSTTPATASRPEKLKEPVASCISVDNISGNSLGLYGVLRIPSLMVTKSKEPSSSCILRKSTCGTIVNTQGFYTPPPLNPATVVFTKNTPNMGVGLFAKRSVEANQVVFTERPLLIFPKELQFYYSRQRLSDEEATKVHPSNFEEILQLALGIMTKEDADAYTSLSNCFPECPKLHGIARSNSFDTGSDIEEENPEEGKFGYAAVGKLASKINHACMPNVRVDFDIPTFSLRFIAERDIKAGDQLFYCYCELNRSVKERRRQLAFYGFVCQCKACVNATPDSDKLREEMADRIRKILDEEEDMLANPRFSVRSLGPLLKLEEDMVKDGLDFGPPRGYGKMNCIEKEMEYLYKHNKYAD